mgnify:CR=1 FL=1
MANSNFVVHNGLTVGPLTIDAATGTLTTTGPIQSTSTSPAVFSGANVVASSGTASTTTQTGALVVVGGDQKLVLQSGDSIKVKSDAATSVDIVMSVMEIS